MEELIQLRQSIEKRDFIAALKIVDELEEMSIEDKLNKIFIYIDQHPKASVFNAETKQLG